MKCEPNYILSGAQQQALPSEKLISECPLHPVSITAFPKVSAAVLVNVQSVGNRQTQQGNSIRVARFNVATQTHTASQHAFIHKLPDDSLADFLKE